MMVYFLYFLMYSHFLFFVEVKFLCICVLELTAPQVYFVVWILALYSFLFVNRWIIDEPNIALFVNFGLEVIDSPTHPKKGVCVDLDAQS